VPPPPQPVSLLVCDAARRRAHFSVSDVSVDSKFTDSFMFMLGSCDAPATLRRLYNFVRFKINFESYGVETRSRRRSCIVRTRRKLPAAAEILRRVMSAVY